MAVYKLGAVLFPHLKNTFKYAIDRISRTKQLTTIFEESKDFSFIDCINSEKLERMRKTILNVYLKYAFHGLKDYLESLKTSRKGESHKTTHSQQIFEKTESITKRIHSLMYHISDKQTSSVPKLSLKKTNSLGQSNYFSSNRSIGGISQSKVSSNSNTERLFQSKISFSSNTDRLSQSKTSSSRLLKEINYIAARQLTVKYLRYWKQYFYKRKADKLKIYTITVNKNTKIAIKYFLILKKFFYRKNGKNHRLRLGRSIFLVKFIRKAFRAFTRVTKNLKKVKSITLQKANDNKSIVFNTWKVRVSVNRIKKLKKRLGENLFSKKLLGKCFKYLKIRTKELKLSKNHKEIACVFYEDKISILALKLLKKSVQISKISKEKKLKSTKFYYKNTCKKYLKLFEAQTNLTKKNSSLKNSANLFFFKSNQKKFFTCLLKQYKATQDLIKKLNKAKAFKIMNLLTIHINHWKNAVQVAKVNKFKKYQSFLTHCKNLIEKSFYGWKKIHPRERYRRIRTIRLQNHQDWNIIDSYFCEWIRLTSIRLKKAYQSERLYKIKSIKKSFESLASHYKKKSAAKSNLKKKIKVLNCLKKANYLRKLKSYTLYRSKKNYSIYEANIIYIQKIFKKWNSLSKKKMMLKYITSYQYSKHLFTRWRNYSYEVTHSKFSRDFYRKNLKQKTFRRWSLYYKTRSTNKKKLNSYIYYKNSKTIGALFDIWLDSFYKKSLENRPN